MTGGLLQLESWPIATRAAVSWRSFMGRALAVGVRRSPPAAYAQFGSFGPGYRQGESPC